MKYSYKSILAFLFAIILNGGCGDQKKVHPATATSSLKTSSKATPPADTPAGANASQNQEAEKKEDGTVKGGLDENPKEENKEEEEEDEEEEEKGEEEKDANETLNDGLEKDGNGTSGNQKSNTETQQASNAGEQREKLTLDEQINDELDQSLSFPRSLKFYIDNRIINKLSLSEEVKNGLIQGLDPGKVDTGSIFAISNQLSNGSPTLLKLQQNRNLFIDQLKKVCTKDLSDTEKQSLLNKPTAQNNKYITCYLENLVGSRNFKGLVQKALLEAFIFQYKDIYALYDHYVSDRLAFLYHEKKIEKSTKSAVEKIVKGYEEDDKNLKKKLEEQLKALKKYLDFST